MNTVYRLNVNELNYQFIEFLSDVDETAYLLQSEPNRKRLLQAVQNISNRQNLVEVPVDMLQ